MPIDITIDHDEHIVHAVCYGKITLANIRQYQREVWGSDDTKGYRELFDTSRSDVSDFSLSDASIVAEQGLKNDLGSCQTKTAMVISSGKQEQIAIIYSAVRGLNADNPRTIKSFLLFSIALEWLNE